MLVVAAVAVQCLTKVLASPEISLTSLTTVAPWAHKCFAVSLAELHPSSLHQYERKLLELKRCATVVGMIVGKATATTF